MVEFFRSQFLVHRQAKNLGSIFAAVDFHQGEVAKSVGRMSWFLVNAWNKWQKVAIWNPTGGLGMVFFRLR